MVVDGAEEELLEVAHLDVGIDLAPLDRPDEDLTHGRPRGVAICVHGLSHVGVMRRDLQEARCDLSEARLVVLGLSVGVPVVQFGGKVTLVLDVGAPTPMLHHRPEDGLLVRPSTVDGGLGDPGLGGQSIGCECGQTTVCKQPECGIEDRVACRVSPHGCRVDHPIAVFHPCVLPVACHIVPPIAAGVSPALR